MQIASLRMQHEVCMILFAFSGKLIRSSYKLPLSDIENFGKQV